MAQWPPLNTPLGEDVCFWPQPKEIGLKDPFLFFGLHNFERKIGPNLSKDLFFWFSPNFGQKIGLN